MNGHLSSEDLARYFVESASDAALERHLRDCPECRAELAKFGSAVSAFRAGFRERVDASQSARAPALDIRETRAGARRWRPALALASVAAIGLIPLVTLDTVSPDRAPEVSAQEATELMDSINLHLSRDLPGPMEPLMLVFPVNDPVEALGGIQ